MKATNDNNPVQQLHFMNEEGEGQNGERVRNYNLFHGLDFSTRPNTGNTIFVPCRCCEVKRSHSTLPTRRPRP